MLVWLFKYRYSYDIQQQNILSFTHQLTYENIIYEALKPPKSSFFWTLQVKINSTWNKENNYFNDWSHGSSWNCMWLPMPTLCIQVSFPRVFYLISTIYTHFVSTHSTYIHISVYIHKVSEVRFSLSVKNSPISSMDKYEVVKDLGAGNFGVARLLRHKETKDLVAMKYIERGQKVYN